MRGDANTAWAELERELDAWDAAGRTATLWWRDDDAIEPGPALDRLLDIAARHGAPIALAVIPADAGPALAQRLAHGDAAVAVLQHGFAHRNHAPPGKKKSELGADRPVDEVLRELSVGQAKLATLFDGTPVSTLPVLVPPWNRIDPALVARLAAIGFTGLSTYNARPARCAAPGLLQVNTHVDIVDWRGGRGFVGTDAAIGLMIGHLEARRLGGAEADEPTGLITHHLVHDAACWRFCEQLAARIAGHRAARWLDAATIFNLRSTEAPA